jgi:hypothetical protein
MPQFAASLEPEQERERSRFAVSPACADFPAQILTLRSVLQVREVLRTLSEAYTQHRFLGFMASCLGIALLANYNRSKAVLLLSQTPTR